MQKIRFIVFLICVASVTLAQTKKLDSLWTVYNNKTQTDSHRLNALHTIAWSYNSNKPDTAIILAEEVLLLAQTSKQKIFEGKALVTLGMSYQNKADYPKALDYYLKALTIREELRDKKGIANCYNNIGNVYYNETVYPKALEHYLKALKIREEIGDKKGIAGCYNNIGIIYKEQKNYTKALEYYLATLKIFEETTDKKGMATCYDNIGNIYSYQANLAGALEQYFKALKIHQEMNDKKGLEICYLNMGEVYNKLVDSNPDNCKEAIHCLNLALQITKEIGEVNNERKANEILAQVYAKMGDFKQAYQNHVKFKQLTDSIFNTENSKQLGDMKTKFEVEKKETELKAKAAAQEAISAEEKKRQQFVIYAVAGILLLVIIFSLFLFNRFRIIQKQKKIIEEQKILVDKAYEKLHERNKEVIDSIHYARRIQSVLITSEKYIGKQLGRLVSGN